MRVGQRFHYIQWISVDRCWYSESGNDYRTVENPDMDLFTIETSDKSSNSTSQNRGIIPGIIYKLI